MRSIILSAILALASLCANAAPLPSSISGAYLTPERGCRLELYRFTAPQWTQIDLQCLRWGDGLHTSMLATVFTPNGQCPSDLSLPFDPRGLVAAAGKGTPADASILLSIDGQWRPMPMLKSGSVEYWSIRSFAPTALSVAVGIDQSALLNGGGIVQTWQLVESIASRSPYSCAGKRPISGGALGR